MFLKGVEGDFCFVFRLDLKLFIDDIDIKYCKVFNCCKLLKVSIEMCYLCDKLVCW